MMLWVSLVRRRWKAQQVKNDGIPAGESQETAGTSGGRIGGISQRYRLLDLSDFV